MSSPHTTVVISDSYSSLKPLLLNAINNFDNFGEIIQAERNIIRVGIIEDLRVTIKSFKNPNLIQGLIYNSLRKSKAKRSYEHAIILKNKGFLTPEPIAYIEDIANKQLNNSYLISKYQVHDYTIRDVLKNKTRHKASTLKAFTQFTFELHEAGILHLDHSPGNTLIKEVNDNLEFSLIDINRMQFKSLSLQERLNNFVRLTNDEDILLSIAREYAELYQASTDDCIKQLLASKEKNLKRMKLKNKLKRLTNTKK